MTSTPEVTGETASALPAADALDVGLAPRDFRQWEALLALLREAFAYQDGRIDPPSSLHSFDERALEEKARSEHLILARDGADLAGCLFAQPKPDCLYIGKMAVRPASQKRGIGRALLAAAEELARDLNQKTLKLSTRIELVENHAAFSALGFWKTAEKSHPGFSRPTFIEMRKDL